MSAWRILLLVKALMFFCRPVLTLTVLTLTVLTLNILTLIISEFYEII